MPSFAHRLVIRKDAFQYLQPMKWYIILFLTNVRFGGDFMFIFSNTKRFWKKRKTKQKNNNIEMILLHVCGEMIVNLCV